MLIKPAEKNRDFMNGVMDVRNGVYSWWVEPKTLYFNNKTYWSFVDSRSYTWVMSYNHSNGNINRTSLSGKGYGKGFSADDHNAPAIVPGDKKPFVFFWTGHDDQDYIEYRKSKRPNDITELGEIQELGFSSDVSYVQAFRYKENEIFLFTRLGGGDTSQWAFRHSDDNGDTWTDEVIAFDSGVDSWIYILVKYWVDHWKKERLRLSSTDHPNNGDVIGQKIFGGSINCANGNIDDYTGETKANLFDEETLPLDVQELSVVYDPDISSNPSKKTRLLDTGGYIREHVFAEFTDEDDAEYYHITTGSSGGSDFGSPNKICDAGLPIEEPEGNTYYFGGASFVNYWGFTIHLAREDNGNWFIERWQSSDQGETWHKNKTYSMTEYPNKSFRPLSIQAYWERKFPKSFSLLWCEGFYEYYSMARWYSNIKVPVQQ